MRMLKSAGHKVVVTARVKDVATDLLDEYGISYVTISEQRTGTAAMAAELLTRSVKLAQIARKENVDALVGLMGPSIAPVGKLLRKPSFVLYDTEIATRTNRWVYPMATEVITPDCYSAPVNGSHITYNGYHELAYLHPNRFTPDASVLDQFGINQDRPYVVVRLPEFASSHDGNEVDTDSAQWIEWIDELSERVSVHVSSERSLPRALEPFRLRGPVTGVHHVLAYADLVIGESATMAAEAAVVGTPAVFIGATSRGYIDDIEDRYGLVRHFLPSDFEGARTQAVSFLNDIDGGGVNDAHQALVADHIDVSEWLVEHLLTALGEGERP